MTQGLLMLHVAAVAFWIGVLGTTSKPHGYAVAHNHFWIDMLPEVPAVLIVLATGRLAPSRTSTCPISAR
jgi:hypothetical protein